MQVAATRGRLIGPNALGCIYMVVGSLGYVANDMFTRRAVDAGAGVYQALFVRGLAVSCLFAVAMRMGPGIIRRSELTGPIVTRAGAEMLGAVLFFSGLVHLKFANAQTIQMLVPFAVTLTAAVVLHEKVRARSYLSVLIGFVGVLIVIRPTSNGFSAWSLVVLASAACLVFREFATRKVRADVPTMHIAFVTAFGLTCLTGAISLAVGWRSMTAGQLANVAGACCCLIVAYIFTIRATRVGDLNVSSPFRYSTLVGAVILGSVAFGERIDAPTVIGCTLIVVAGVWGATNSSGR